MEVKIKKIEINVDVLCSHNWLSDKDLVSFLKSSETKYRFPVKISISGISSYKN